jgi:hypothetical protein
MYIGHRNWYREKINVLRAPAIDVNFGRFRTPDKYVQYFIYHIMLYNSVIRVSSIAHI